MLYPKNIEQKLGFDHIRTLLKALCISNLGKEEIDKVDFSTHYEKIISKLLLIDECMTLLQNREESIPLGNIADLRPAFKRTQMEGTFLDLKEVIDIRLNISTVRGVIQFIKQRDSQEYPHLLKLVENVIDFPNIENRIDKIINKFGEIKDNASPELYDIRKQIHKAQGSISSTLHAILRKAQTAGYVDKDTAPTLREGRLVIPIPVTNKRRISGIVHDESATGKTAFVEPSEVVEVNNRLRELEQEERREIVKILIEFTDFSRPNFKPILHSVHFLARIEALIAKSKLGIQMQAIRPHLSSKCGLDWIEARHPLLERKLADQGKKIEALNIRLTKKQRILLISGPNAGGKSVCLKTVGLLQYMLQCGLPIPVSPRSRAGIFNSIFIDIGDEQSIENDLSTYSSHLMNMKHMSRNCSPRSMVLIDEFGTGTEPQIGGAIAEAVLSDFNTNQTFGVITTHYSNLKHFASETEGIINGAMLYDRHKMQPLFALSIGSPGSSFALEIAKKIGMPNHILEMANEKLGSQQVDYDKYLQDVVRDKRYWKIKRDKIKEREKRLAELTEKYETQISQLKRKEKEMMREAKTKAAALLDTAGSKIEKTIRDIKEAKADKTKSKEARNQLETFKQKLKKEISKPTPIAKKQRPLKVGDQVKIIGQNMIGELIEINGNNAIVTFGLLKSNVPLKKLELSSKAQAKKQLKETPSLSKETTDNIRNKQLKFKQELDLRGMRVDEALQAVIYYLDDAEVLNIQQVRLLHGTGTGALRQAIRDYLSVARMVKSFRDEHVQFGGAGITIVELL